MLHLIFSHDGDNDGIHDIGEKIDIRLESRLSFSRGQHNDVADNISARGNTDRENHHRSIDDDGTSHGDCLANHLDYHDVTRVVPLPQEHLRVRTSTHPPHEPWGCKALLV